MTLSFVYPIALLLLLLLPVLWVLTLLAQASRPSVAQERKGIVATIFTLVSPRQWVSLTLRIIMLVSLVLALAGTQLVRSVDDMTVVFLIDGSDSVTPAQREWAMEYVTQALQERRSDDKAAIVVFGENALVERTPAKLESLARLTSTPIGNRTNIAEAIQLGIALLPTDTQKRIVLLSDGEENQDRAIEVARMSSVRGISLDVVRLPESSGGDDVMVTALDAPDTAREGQTITLQAYMQSNIETTGQMQVFANGELVGTEEVDIPTGRSSIALKVPVNEAGFNRYEVRLEAKGDTQAINNRGATFTSVEGPPRILLVAREAERAEALQQALRATQARVEVVSPERVPADQAQLKQYTAIVLVDVMAADMPRAVIEALPVYVGEQGGGLAMIGGFESFGAGGWRRSSLEKVLPVALEREDTLQRPDIGLVLVIDRSGSMAEDGGGGMTKLDLAKEAVYQATLGLEQNDQIGVVVFDIIADWIIPVQPLPSLVDIELSLSQFDSNGGTDIRSGIAPAAQALSTLNAKVKHVILLTDGQADSNYADLIQQMQQNGTTITVVSIGDNANPELAQIANIGGGRYYEVLQVTDVPRIFLSETILVIGRDIVEEKFTPAVALPAPIVRGLETFPPLYGYNATEPRLTARTILVSSDGKPILAQWQYGLGRSVAWTSDFKGQWGRDWINWEQFPDFANGFLEMLLPPRRTEGLAIESRTDGNQAILELTIPDTRQTQQTLQIAGRLLDPDDTGVPLEFSQVGANRYRAVTTVDTPGAYLAQVAVSEQNGEPLGTASGGMVVAYSPEYREKGSNPLLLDDLADVTNGRQMPDPATIFEPTQQKVGVIQEVAMPLMWIALLLLPLDIAFRRLLLRKADRVAFFDYVRGLFRPKKPEPAAQDDRMARLFAAKERAKNSRDSGEDSRESGGNSREPGEDRD